MGFFSERSDMLLREWLMSPTWHIDKPSENTKFYHFVAMLMRESGQPDIREVRCTLEEAAKKWATDYESNRGDVLIALQCDRLQVLYDYFTATQGKVQCTLPSDAASPQCQSLAPIVPSTLSPLQKISVLPTSQDSTLLPSESTRLPKARKTRPRTEVLNEAEVLNEHLEDDNFPSQARWQLFWPVVIRLHTLLLERRGEQPSPRIPQDNQKAIHAEMVRWVEEVLTATEITGAEKRDLIGTVLEKVILPDNNIEGSTITIKWLR